MKLPIAIPIRGQKPQEKKLAMVVNSNKPEQWKQDIAASGDMYNDWFMCSAPVAFRQTRERTTKEMEKSNRLPPKMAQAELNRDLKKIGQTIEQMTDPDLFIWLGRKTDPIERELFRAATIVADHWWGAEANPVLRNAQEKRQFCVVADTSTAVILSMRQRKVLIGFGSIALRISKNSDFS